MKEKILWSIFCLLNIGAILASGIIGGIVAYNNSGNLTKAICLGPCYSMLSIFLLFLFWFCLAAVTLPSKEI